MLLSQRAGRWAGGGGGGGIRKEGGQGRRSDTGRGEEQGKGQPGKRRARVGRAETNASRSKERRNVQWEQGGLARSRCVQGRGQGGSTIE